MQTLRLVTITFVAAIAMLLFPLPAHADPFGGVNCSTTPDDPRCVVQIVITGGSSANAGGTGGESLVCTVGGAVVKCHSGFGWLSSDGCYYEPDTPSGLINQYIRRCFNPANGTFDIWSIVTLVGQPTSLALITQRAIAELGMPKPVIAANPNLAAPQVVHVPVWFWIQPGWWRPHTATATVAGFSITATATPTKVTWYAGDGTSTVCAGPGTAWTRAAGPTAASPTCGHTYTTTSAHSPGGTFQLRAVVSWNVAWSGMGISGTEPNITTASTTTVEVRQFVGAITS